MMMKRSTQGKDENVSCFVLPFKKYLRVSVCVLFTFSQNTNTFTDFTFLLFVKLLQVKKVEKEKIVVHNMREDTETDSTPHYLQQ